MGKFSAIEWTMHTFNTWWGCENVSPACDNCYAEVWAKRCGQKVWGKDAPRRFFGDKHWNEPLKWDREAASAGERHRVFCSSMADVFEKRDDLTPHRERLWDLIDRTPNLDWLLLTKRPHIVKQYQPWGNDWPHNVWLGTTVEQQKFVRSRLTELRTYPAAVRFISAEPLLEGIDIRPYLIGEQRVDWVICGGESGPGCRPMHAEWAQSLRDQCGEADVPFHFKQWGDHDSNLVKIGKKKAGRHIDGRVWNGLPLIQVAAQA